MPEAELRWNAGPRSSGPRTTRARPQGGPLATWAALCWIRKSRSRSIPIVAPQFRACPHVTNRPTSAATNPPGAPVAPTALLSRVNRRELIVGLLLFGSTLLLYAQVWNFGYCILDDSAYVTDNGYVQQGLTRAGVEWSFTTVHDANWIPLTWISLMLDSDLYGGARAAITSRMPSCTPPMPCCSSWLCRGQPEIYSAAASSRRSSPCIRCMSNRWRGSPSARTS